MEKLVAQSNIGTDKNGAQAYNAAVEAIAVEGGKISNLFRNFKEFIDGQQEKRLGWAVSATAVQVFVLVPITLLAVAFNGNEFGFWIPVIITSFFVALCNLMALPTKIVIPAFFTSVMINAAVIALSFIL